LSKTLTFLTTKPPVSTARLLMLSPGESSLSAMRLNGSSPAGFRSSTDVRPLERPLASSE